MGGDDPVAVVPGQGWYGDGLKLGVSKGRDVSARPRVGMALEAGVLVPTAGLQGGGDECGACAVGAWSARVPRASVTGGKVDLVAQIALVLVGDVIRDAIAAGGRSAARLGK